MFEKLRKHHLGFIIPLGEKEALEQRTGRKFTYDEIQGTHVLFDYDPILRTYIEYICQEGRVAKQKPGFAHVCYDLADETELARVEEYVESNKMGYPLTELEQSGSKECGMIKFYFIKNQGVIELNVREAKEACSPQPKTI